MLIHHEKGRIQGKYFGIENDILYLKNPVKGYLHCCKTLKFKRIWIHFCDLRQNLAIQNISLPAEHSSLVLVIYQQEVKIYAI